ncbi:HHR246Cp [Eremothecium sinecaudum]|uniref:Serine/threonine-protein phosphatase 2A activator n=1 Tax=Eremothecium sinecaudum TaxID=45286 RepID=A0A0X8HX25_9SACH|nr:HHR246Cp [Eremothecium sinecaudum]AMD23015.1 HHR246Cp [Eremothecium sinecaudum]
MDGNGDITKFNLNRTKFSQPVKRISDVHGANDFQRSLTMHRLQTHLEKYLEMVHGVDVPSSSSNPNVNRFVRILERLGELISETPARADAPRRFGNLARRDWQDKLEAEQDKLWEEFLPIAYGQIYRDSIIELRFYLGSSFGSRERLDYGTGHELAFLAVFVAVDMLGVWNFGGAKFTGEDFLFIWYKYYELVHRLILEYTLEPAGSHGVWGLDDHMHLQYIIGASQWAGEDKKAPIRPPEVQNSNIVESYAATNLYCNAIAFIFRVKSGPFAQHSPMLFDISRNVLSWNKVASGLIKMYRVEVLSKFPVVQHFGFGTGFFPWVDITKGRSLPAYENNDDHAETTGTVSIHTSPPVLGKTMRPLQLAATQAPTTAANANNTMPPPRMTVGGGHSTLGRYTVPRR